MFVKIEKILVILMYICFFLLFFSIIFRITGLALFFILALFLIILPTLFITKINKSKELTEELGNSIPLEDVDKYVDENPIFSLNEKDFRQKLNSYNKRGYFGIISCLLGVFLSFLYFPIILFPIGVWMLITGRKDVPLMRAWFIKRLDIPLVSNIQIITRSPSLKFQPITLLKKYFLKIPANLIWVW